MKKRQWLGLVVILAVLVGLAVWAWGRIPFDFAVFAQQFRRADWSKIGLSFALILIAYLFRAVRWALLMRHQKRVSPLSLLGTQVIGFTAVALIGRVADPVRPYLAAKRTGMPLGNQIAIYIVERLFDAGSMALIFSCAMIAVPTAEILHALHPHAAAQAGSQSLLSAFLVRYGGLALTLLGALFLLLIRVSGTMVARFFEGALGLVSHKIGQSAGHKIRAFHAGLDTMRSLGDLLAVLAVSLSMWVLILLSYFFCCRAFTFEPALAAITMQKTVLLMIASGGASVIQLPVVGWFSQIGIVAVALAAVLGIGSEVATACATSLLLSTFLGVVPIGLIWAQVEKVSLRTVTQESGQASEELESAES